MNRFLLLFVLLFVVSPAQAANKFFQGHCFEASVVAPSVLFEGNSWGNGDLIQVREGDEYSLVVRNPLPVRVAAAVTVDGLNTIDGKRTTPANGQKWIIEPYSSITVKGWQTNGDNARRFIFTRAGKSYAKWKEDRDRRDYSNNLGVIGVAFFWSGSELYAALNPPRAFANESFEGGARDRALSGSVAAPKSLRKEERAGTGMGRNEWNPVTQINFYYDTGMYSPADALTIRYEFGDRSPQPMPFDEPNVQYRYRQNYAPEMP